MRGLLLLGVPLLGSLALAAVRRQESESPPTPTIPADAIETPQPVQPGMVEDCDEFHLVTSGQTCLIVAEAYGITLQQFISWNPAVGTDCNGLWLNYYVCVSTVDHDPSPPTPTESGTNGIETPEPIQPGMVDDCDEFHLVASGNTCQVITSQYGISLADFITWNPDIGGEECTGLWLGFYVCVSVVGDDSEPPTPTSPPGNGVETPLPIQDGMTPDCAEFHLVQAGQTCEVIASQYDITVADFTEWNPAAGPNCEGLWAEFYACVAIL